VLLAGILLLAALALPTGVLAARTLGPHPSNVSPLIRVYPDRPDVPEDSRLMLTPAQWQADQQGPSMDSILPPDGIAMQAPIFFWWLALELLGILAFPFAFLMLGGLADRGWVIAKTLGPIVLAYLVWIGPATGLVQFDRTEVVAACALFAVAAAVTAVVLRKEIISFVRAEWRAVLTAEAVFLAGFALFLWLRAWYPDLGHQYSPVSPTNPGDGRMGEKQMEMAFLNAIIRSRVFPPLDPFFAHGYINYYYFGFVLVATLCKLTQITTATGFNLAIATFFAMLVGNIFTVTRTLTRRAWAGVAASAFVGIIGNLAGGWQVITDLMAAGGAHSSFPVVGGLIDTASGIRAVILDHAQLNAFDFWEPTRIVPPVGLDISEFPYFTYLFADLHPHLMAFPMTAAALAFAVSLALSGYSSAGRGIVAWALGAVLFGALLATNPWDFPTYLVVVGIGALVGAYVARGRLVPALLARPVLWCVALAAGGFILFYPFERSYKTVFDTGIGLTRDMVQPICKGSASSCTGDAYNTLVTPLGIYLEHFGLFLFLLLSLVALLLARSGKAGHWLTRLQFVYYYRDRFDRVRRAGRVVRRMQSRQRTLADPSIAVGTLVVAGGLAVVHLYLLAFLAAVIGLVLILIQRALTRLPAPDLFILVLALVPLGLSLLTQVVYVKDFLNGGNAFRMNTIFKFYNQAWILFAVVGAYALWFVVTQLMPERRPIVQPVEENGAAVEQQESPLAAFGRFVDRHLLWSACLGILLIGSLVYTYAGSVSRETYRSVWLPESSVPLTLDGMAFMKVAYPGDYAGISWLNAHVSGAPVIAEADNGYYQWPSRVSMFTGLPDIINGNHEGVEQRYPDELDPTGLCSSAAHPGRCASVAHSRDDDLKRLYESTDIATKESVIRAYGIGYIYVGFSERQQFPAAGLGAFRRMVGHGLHVAFRQSNTVIYRVTAT
jgi:YYY domain-containing protein